MTLKPSYRELEREDLTFAGELGWLAALAFAVVTFLPRLFG